MGVKITAARAPLKADLNHLFPSLPPATLTQLKQVVAFAIEL
jgi:hypothetical protein